MTNEQLIKKILKKINHKTYTLSKSIIIEDDEYMWIVPYGDKEYDFYLSANTWEISLDELTNRELIKLYQSL